MGYIYLLVFANGRGYIGQTRQPTVARRFATHRQDAKRRNSPIYEAWRKFGEPKCFTLATLSVSELSAAEVNFISTLRTTTPSGYNEAPGGAYVNMTPNTARKIGDKLRGRKQPQSATDARAAKLKGRKHSAETIAKRAASCTGQKRTDETRALMSKRRREAWAQRTPEQRAAIAAKATETKRARHGI